MKKENFKAQGLCGEMDVVRIVDDFGNVLYVQEKDSQHVFERYERFDDDGESEDYAYKWVLLDDDGEVMREMFCIAYDSGRGLEDLDVSEEEFLEKVDELKVELP